MTSQVIASRCRPRVYVRRDHEEAALVRRRDFPQTLLVGGALTNSQLHARGAGAASADIQIRRREPIIDVHTP